MVGRPHSNNNPNLELIYKDFVQTFWGQKTVDDLIWYHTREKFADRKGAVISIYYDQSTGLTILDGKNDGIPCCIFINPNISHET